MSIYTHNKVMLIVFVITALSIGAAVLLSAAGIPWGSRTAGVIVGIVVVIGLIIVIGTAMDAYEQSKRG